VVVAIDPRTGAVADVAADPAALQALRATSAEQIGVDGHALVAGEGDGSVVRIEPGAAPVALLPADEGAASGALVVRGGIAWSARADAIVGIDAATAAERFRVAIPGTFVLAADDDVVAALAFAGPTPDAVTLAAFDVASGRERFRVDLQTSASAVAVAGGVIVVEAGDGERPFELVGLDAATGAERFRRTLARNEQGLGLVAAGGGIWRLASLADGGLEMVRIALDDGAPTRRRLPWMPVVAVGGLLVASAPDALVLLDPVSGAELSRVTAGSGYGDRLEPIAVVDGKLLARRH